MQGAGRSEAWVSARRKCAWLEGWAGPQVGVVKSQEAEPTWRLEGTQLRDRVT